MLIYNYGLIILLLNCVAHRTICYNLKNISKINAHKLNDNKIYMNKWSSYNKLLRTENCAPTFMLNFLAGWLTNPSYKILLNINFWIFSLITQLTMMNSMVINDLFDLKIDLINNSNRPLVNKQISIKEARCLYICITIIINIFSLVFFKNNNFYLHINTINLILFLYTPILKKILLIKNITCASIVSSTIMITSKSIMIHDLNDLVYDSHNFNMIHITSRFLFLSSLYIELLLDIKDIKGDKENGILTFPNFFGERKTLNSLIVIFIYNLFYHGNIFYKYKKYTLMCGFILSNTIFLYNLIKLRYKSITDEKILSAAKQTTISLFIFIISIIFT